MHPRQIGAWRHGQNSAAFLCKAPRICISEPADKVLGQAVCNARAVRLRQLHRLAKEVHQPRRKARLLPRGKQLADENLDFYYQNLQIEEKQILLTNRQELCVYTLNGRKKYSGVVSETQIHEILGMGQNRYLLAEEDGVSMIRLK